MRGMAQKVKSVAWVGFYSPDEKWHLRNVTSDLFQWPLTGVAQVPLFDLVAFFGFYTNLVKETKRPPNKYNKMNKLRKLPKT